MSALTDGHRPTWDALKILEQLEVEQLRIDGFTDQPY